MHFVSKTKTGCRDQGDGIFIIPVLNADYPDIDLEKVDDTYFMITSKQRMSQGTIILGHKNCAHWSVIEHEKP